MKFTAKHRDQVAAAIVAGDATTIYDLALAVEDDKLSKNLYWIGNDVKAVAGDPELLRGASSAILLKLRHYCQPEDDA